MIRASLGDLKQLIHLDLNGCKGLKSLPHKINLEALEIIDLGGCSRLKKFPEITGNISHLSELCLSETIIKDLSLLLEHLTNLTKLDLRECKNLSSLPNAMCSLMSLKTLNLSGCSRLDKLPENLGNVEGLEVLNVSGTGIRGLPSSIILLKNLKNLSFSGCDFLLSKPSNKFLNFPLFQRSPDAMSMLMHTLSSLSSLRDLNLSYCNLRAVPDVIGCLSSLTFLQLKGNNFVSLPKNIIQLSHLKTLYLCGCMDLQLLPELPLNIMYINADGCMSLETLPIRPEDDFRPCLSLRNCIKLINNQGYNDMFLTMLRRYIQGAYLGYEYFLIPGSEIPKWFSHQSVGTSLNLQGPLDFMGIVVCAVFIFRKHRPLPTTPWGFTHYLHFSYNVMGSEISDSHGIIFHEQSGKIGSSHLWLKYFPFENFQGKSGNELSQIDANGISQIDVQIETEGPGLEVTKCGAHLVYKQDIEDLKQTMAGSSRCSISPYEDDLDDSAKDIKIKRSRDDFDGDKAGPSGEATNSEVDIPHPKRIRLPNLIERFIPHLGNWIGNSSTQEGDSDCEEEKSQ